MVLGSLRCGKISPDSNDLRCKGSSEIVTYLKEKNEVPDEYSNIKVESKGFYTPVVIQDFPVRGRKLFLNITSG